MPVDEARDRLTMLANVPEKEVEKVFEMLIWFGFLGVSSSPWSKAKYSFDVQGNMRRLLFPLTTGDAQIVIHQAFHAALQVV